MKRTVAFLLLALFSLLTAGAADSSVQLVINGNVTSYSAISMPEPENFWILDAQDKLIPSRKIGDPVVVANWPSWKIKVDSLNKSNASTGRLKLDMDGAETYIPYTFALLDGATVLVTRFQTASSSLPRTTVAGKSLTLYFYFSDDGTRWPAGIYRDTLVFSLIAD